MSVPKSTKIWVTVWAALALTWLLVCAGKAATGDWTGAWSAFASAIVAAYVASLIYERDEAREFRRKIVGAVRRDSGWAS